MSPLVSILIPVYNREQLVRECIASAQAQTYGNIEIIVCDNASTDNTWEVVQEFARGDSRIRSFRNESNVGPVRNWLRCVSEAKGDYVKILFSDDLISPRCVEVLLSVFQDDVAFSYSTALITDTESGAGRIAYASGESAIYSTQRYLELLSEGIAPFSPCAGLFRTSDVKKNLFDMLPTKIARDYWRHGAGPDVMLFALTAKDYPKVAYIRDALVSFRAHGASITIANQGNEVLDGYCGALGWFYLSRVGRNAWLDCLARLWVAQMLAARRWISPGETAGKYEGTGDYRDALQLAFKGGGVIVKKIFAKASSLISHVGSRRAENP